MTAHTQQNASLYVGDLVSDVTEETLFETFKAVGPVLSIRVCRDAVTRRSLGYAYVNFQSPNDAERALETLNYRLIRGNPARIMWSHRDPGLRKSGSGNVFVKNLEKSIDNLTLFDTFSQFGNILSCKVSTDNNKASRGYGFVHFESEESAKAAIEKVNGMLMKSLQVFVGLFVPRSQRHHQHIQQFTNVYAKELKAGLTKEALQEYFGKVGQVKSVYLTADIRGRPFAFSDFEQHEAAVRAIEQCHGQFVPELCDEGQLMYLQRAQKKSERFEELNKRFAQMRARRINQYSVSNQSNIYIKNLEDDVDDMALRKLFERFGEITSCKVMCDAGTPPTSKGFGFVCFKNVENSNKAISAMNGQIGSIGAKPLYVNFAQRKEVRRATLQIQYAGRASGMSNPGGLPGNYAGFSQPMYPSFPSTAASGYMYQQPGGRGMMQGAQMWAQQQMPGGMPSGMRPPFPGRGRGMPSTRGRPPWGGGRGFQAPLPHQVPAMHAPHAPTVPVVPNQSSLTKSMQQLQSLTQEQQKHYLGERLFARIVETHNNEASKITGMLLEMDVTEILNLLESPDILKCKIDEAMGVLKEHTQQSAE